MLNLPTNTNPCVIILGKVEFTYEYKFVSNNLWVMLNLSMDTDPW